MKLGYVGLGKMGFNMVERLLEKGHNVVVFDKSKEAVADISKKGAEPAINLQSMASVLSMPRLIWLRVPCQAVDNPSFTGQIVSALRNQFGGHEVFKKGKGK